MTDVTEVQKLNSEIANLKAAMEGLLAQLDASKQMYNDAINVSFQLKTQVILLQKQLSDRSKEDAPDKE
jgi:hypothetical protein